MIEEIQHEYVEEESYKKLNKTKLDPLYTEMKESFDKKIFPILIFPLELFAVFGIFISSIVAAIIFYPIFTLWLLLYWTIMFPIIITVRYLKYNKIFKILFVIGLFPLFIFHKLMQHIWNSFNIE